MTIDRRTFIASAAGTATLSALEVDAAPAAASDGPVFLATWKHGKPANERAARVFAGGGSLIDAVEKGINVVENDPTVQSVGYGGLPNAEGEVELDAAIMDGTRHRVGAAINLHHIKNPISVARLVMEKTRHSTLAGEGAFRFALEMGFQPEQLLTPDSLKQWIAWKDTPNHQTFWISQHSHDTIGLVAADGAGHVVSGCSTSGLAWKLPGRIADSGLVGSGVYADDNGGAASATGNGDIMQNFCTSFFIVTLMAAGRSPQEACEQCLRHMTAINPATKSAQACVIAIDPKGNVGAASMNGAFTLDYALWRNGTSALHRAPAVF
jgi:N4-(beta-N-acetylglucosaminyl)-L-asparaginase